MEHLLSDIKNIKMSLNRITKYILNKSVERGIVNDFNDFKGIGKVVWEFISTIYDSGWNTLYINDNTLFRNKVLSKFTPKINHILKNKSNNETEKLASVSNLPSPISTKSSKKVKDIEKFFKKNNNIKGKEISRKLYTQTLLSSNIVRETLKIKEAFPKLQDKKIENIQKIIYRGDKLEPCINMTTKGSLYKQVIILINNNNTVKFMSKLSDHVININRLLKKTSNQSIRLITLG